MEAKWSEGIALAVIMWGMIWDKYELKGSVKELSKFHIYETEKIIRKASDAAEYIELFGSFNRDRHAQRI